MRFTHSWLAASRPPCWHSAPPRAAAANSSTQLRRSASARPARRSSAAPSTAPARPSPRPIYQQWAARPQGSGHHRQLPAVGSGAGVAQFTAGHRRLRRHRPGAEATRRSTAAKKKGAPVHIPTVFGAITVSYNLSGRQDGPQARRRDDRRHLPRQGQEVERPGDRQAEPGRRPCPTRRSRSPPLRLVGHDQGLHAVPGRLQPRVEERPGVDKTVKWPTGTGAKGNDGVAGGRQADRRRGRLRRAGLRAAEQLHLRSGEEQVRQVRRADARVHLGRRRRPRRSRRTCASRPSTRRAPTAYPIVSQTFVIVHKDLCKAGMTESKAKVFKAFIDYGLGDGQNVGQAAVLRAAAARSRRKAKAAGRRQAAVQRQPALRSRWKPDRSPPRGDRSVLERSPRARAAGPALSRRLLTRARGSGSSRSSPTSSSGSSAKSSTAFAKFGVLGFIFGDDWDVVAAAVRGAGRCVVGTLDHVGHRAAHRRADRRRHRAVPHRAVPAAPARAADASSSSCSRPCRRSSTGCGASSS